MIYISLKKFLNILWIQWIHNLNKGLQNSPRDCFLFCSKPICLKNDSMVPGILSLKKTLQELEKMFNIHQWLIVRIKFKYWVEI